MSLSYPSHKGVLPTYIDRWANLYRSSHGPVLVITRTSIGHDVDLYRSEQWLILGCCYA